LEFSDSLLFLLGLELVIFDLTLGTSLEASDLLSHIGIVVEVGSEGGGQVVKLSFVLLSDFGQADNGGVLLVDKLSEGGLSSNKAVWDVHLSAEGGEPYDELDWVNVVSDADNLSLSLFYELGDVVESELEVVGSLLIDRFF
jgi:hypothetical protein